MKAQLLCEACHSCGGEGILKTPVTVCYDIFREILRKFPGDENVNIEVLAAPAVIDHLRAHEPEAVAGLEQGRGAAISLRPKPGYGREQFDIQRL